MTKNMGKSQAVGNVSILCYIFNVLIPIQMFVLYHDVLNFVIVYLRSTAYASLFVRHSKHQL